jgi:hypothetical protein
MGMHESEGNRRLRVVDGFSRQLSRVTHARRMDGAYAASMGEVAAIHLVGSDTAELDKITRKLRNVLNPNSSLYPSAQMQARLQGSLLTVMCGSALIKEAQKTGRSLRETSADERIKTDPKVQKRRHEAFNTAFHTAVEDVLTDREVKDMVAVASLSATAVATGNNVDITMASTHLQWLKHEAERLAESDPEFAGVAGMAEGILDVVRPVLHKTQELFAAA